MTVIHFAVGRCQHGRGGCQAAAAFDERSKIVSPDFSTPEALDAWLAEKAKNSAGRRCRSCRRPIAIQHFERRTKDLCDDNTWNRTGTWR